MMRRGRKSFGWVRGGVWAGIFAVLFFAGWVFAGDKIGIDLEWRPITGLGLPPPAETLRAVSGERQGHAPEAGAPGKTWTDPVTGMVFVWVQGGCYQMGCGSWTDSCDDDEKPVHDVCLDGFWLGKYEVTQGQWEKVMGDNPSNFKKGSSYPVEQVSWNDCQKFIDRLNGKSGGSKFGLPTEAQWEFACRSGGKPEKYAGGGDVDRVAWYDKNSGSSTHEVGTKAPNGLGIYDMSGNVWEWCEDWYADKYQSGSQKNPTGPAGGAGRVVRGGSWHLDARNVRCGDRGCNHPDFGSAALGFRLLRTN